jgi:hypothetical protein
LPTASPFRPSWLHVLHAPSVRQRFCPPRSRTCRRCRATEDAEPMRSVRARVSTRSHRASAQERLLGGNARVHVWHVHRGIQMSADVLPCAQRAGARAELVHRSARRPAPRPVPDIRPVPDTSLMPLFCSRCCSTPTPSLPRCCLAPWPGLSCTLCALPPGLVCSAD